MSRARGSVLVVVAGLSAVLVAMALALLARMRSDGEEAAAGMRQAQARVMLDAALAYVQETARLGWTWDDPAHPGEKAEAYGWSDVRDGSPGPKDRYGNVMARAAGGGPAFDAATGLATGPGGGRFPAVGGRAARCPMHALVQPPFAVEPIWAANPLPREPRPYAQQGAVSTSWRDDLSYANLDPLPVESAADRAAAGDWARRFAVWKAGDPRIRPASAGRAWFRVYRATREDCAQHRTLLGAPAPLAWSPAVFFLTCGAGPTLGFRDWQEVVDEGATGEFADDPGLFAELRAGEELLWFACEWSPAQGFGASVHTYFPGTYVSTAFQLPLRDGWEQRTHSMNFGGSFLWIERLATAPARW